MDTTRIYHQDDTVEAHYAGLERLQDLQVRYNHEDLGIEDRGELRDRIQKLSRRLGAGGR